MKKLSDKAITRLFKVLAERYGGDFTARLEDVDLNDMRASWATGLARYADRLEIIGRALQQLPAACPTLASFYDLCQRIEVNGAAPAASTAPIARAPIAKPATMGHDPKAWAKRLVARHCAGERLHKVQIEFAREALRLPKDGSRDREYADLEVL